MRAFSLVSLLAAAACSGPSGTGLDVDASVDIDAGPLDGTALCAGGYGRVEDWGALGDADLTEASGLVAAPRSPGVFWTHNDSGDGARLFAVAQDGRALAHLYLPDVTAVDFEDIAAGPCPDGQAGCLFVADTGNNLLNRDEVSVYITPEPAVQPDQAFAIIDATSVLRIPVLFPVDVVDIEALAVAPDGQTLYFFEKNNLEQARLFQLEGPFVDGQSMTLEAIAEFDSPGLGVNWGRAITGAALHTTGTRMLVRVYTGVYEYRLDAGQTMADFAAIEPVLAVAGPLVEPQGEAVAYDAAGSGIVTVSEDPDGLPGQVLHHYSCE